MTEFGCSLPPSMVSPMSDRHPNPVHDSGNARDGSPLWDAVHMSRRWLDSANGTEPHELTCRILKLTEEAGEAAAAWIGVVGQNPRKGVTHTRADVVRELADVAFTALVAIESLDTDARTALDDCAEKVLNRLAPPTP